MKKLFTLLIMAAFVAWASVAFAATGDPILEPITIDEIESTDVSGSDGTLISGTAGTDTYAAVWNSDGDLVDGPGVPATIALDNLVSVAINTSLISDTAGTDDLGSEAIFWQTLYLKSTISFEGATDNDYQTSFSVTDPTVSDKTITVPNSNETIGVATSAAADAIDAITEIAAALKTGSDTKLVTGTAGASGNAAAWNGDGDLVDGGAITPGSLGTGDAQTVSSGVVDASGGANYVIVTGESDSEDSVTEVQGAAAGDVIVFKGKTGLDYDITWTDGTYLELQANFIMNNQADTITLLCTTLSTNDTFTELARANNG